MLYTCPMHPDIRKEGPGHCPICGMSLEPMHVTNEPTEDTEYQDMSRRFWIAAALSLPLLVLNMAPHLLSSTFLMTLTMHPLFNWFQLLLASPVVLWAGFPFFMRGIDSLKTRNLNMFTLIALGISVAYVYSLFITLAPNIMSAFFGDALKLDVYFEAAAVITALVLLGQVLELKARSETSLAVKQLLDLTPKTAHLISSFAHQTESDILVSKIQAGQYLRIKPGERIPVDGIIVTGHSSVDQSMITGESIPIEKTAGDPVIGGTLNGTGSFIIEATKVGQDTLLSQIVDMVLKAQRSKAPIQKLVNEISAYFVPSVMLTALITFILWYIFGPSPQIGYAIYTSVAVLIIACPCALGLATPMSIMVGTGRGAREGVLIKSAEALEKLAKINVLVLDKTGTLTVGKPHVVDIMSFDHRYSQAELLSFAASLEQNSEHPLAEAILKKAQDKEIALKTATQFQSITGKGVIGQIADKTIALGNQALLQSLNIEIAFHLESIEALRSLGQTIMFIVIENQLAGYIAITDQIKPDTRLILEALTKLQIKIIMLTGDNQQTAEAIASQLNIHDVKADILPQDKFHYIEELQKQGYIVGMAGDGINDAPALMQAHVGIAMGNGTDIAMESADIVLVSGDLNGILRARHLSELTLTNIKQNLFLAFIYNTIAIPLAAGLFYPHFGLLLSPVIASAAMSFSSVSVIANALRLSRSNL